MEIVPYRKEYREDFIRLNMAWLERYDLLEPADLEAFERVEQSIAHGAMIYFAMENGAVIASCMIEPMGNNAWELCKLGVLEEYRGKGAGKAVFLACMNYAEQHGAEKVVLVSNHVLTTAIAMYERYGFTHVPLDPACAIYETADVQMEYCFDGGKHHADRTL